MNNYNSKQIILSLKDKLKQLEEKLKDLSSLTQIEENKNVKSIKYRIASSFTKPEVFCDINYNDTTFCGKVRRLKTFFNGNLDSIETGKVVRDNSDRMYIMNKKIDIVIPDNNQNMFQDIYHNLVDDEFVRRFFINNPLYSYSANDNIDVYSDRIIMEFIERTSQSSYIVYAFYNVMDNTITFSAPKSFNITNETIENAFNIPIPKDNLNEYQQNFLNLSNTKDKKIIIPEFGVSHGKIIFKMEESTKGFYLTKK